MTELSLKLMERADKTLSFGCILSQHDGDITTYYKRVINVVDDVIYISSISGGLCKIRNWDTIIGHPYGFESLERLRITLLGVDGVNREMKYIYEYIEKNNFDPLLKKCIDRPEEGQKLVIEFLETLPKSAP